MSENPPSGAMHGHGASGFPPAPTGFQPGPPAWQPAPPKGQSRGLTYVALAVAVVATVLAIVGWFRPTPPPAPAQAAAPTYSEQQIADAKTKACTAFELVDKGVVLQTGGETRARANQRSRDGRSAGGGCAAFAGRGIVGTCETILILRRLRNWRPQSATSRTIMSKPGAELLGWRQGCGPAQAALIKEGDASLRSATLRCANSGSAHR